jgi:hypothetical protein
MSGGHVAMRYDETRLMGRLINTSQSGMGQIKGTARAKLGQSYLLCNRVAFPWSRSSGVVVGRDLGFVSS